MRSHAEEIEKNYPLQYWKLTAENQALSYEDKHRQTLKQHTQVDEVVMYVIEDKFFAVRIRNFCQQQNLRLTIVDSPLFINTIADFQDYVDRAKRPFMHYFYVRAA